jgi:hypothetical protein
LAVSWGCLGVDGCGTMLDLALAPPASVNSVRPGEIVLWNEDGPLPGFVGVIVLLKGVGAAATTKGNWNDGAAAEVDALSLATLNEESRPLEEFDASLGGVT